MYAGRVGHSTDTFNELIYSRIISDFEIAACRIEPVFCRHKLTNLTLVRLRGWFLISRWSYLGASSRRRNGWSAGLNMGLNMGCMANSTL